MSPSELEQFLRMRPMPNLRLTLASGDQMIIKEEDEPFVIGLSLIVRGDRLTQDVNINSKLVSVPNIVLAETVSSRPRGGARRRIR